LHPVELIICLLAAAVVLGILSRLVRVPDPILLVLGGLLLGLQPGVPQFTLDHNLVFLLFLPPLLYAGAFHTDWNEFRTYIRPISMLAIGLVLGTSAAVALVANRMFGLPLAYGFLLGAIISPPDAVAAMAITKRLKVPRRLTAILEGESLVNDASALVAYRMALAAIASGYFSIVQASWKFVSVSIGGIAIGLFVGWLATRIHPYLERKKLTDAKLSITITLLTPFAAYLPAEHLHVSGVLAVVTAGLWVGNRCEMVFSKKLYEEAKSVWEWIDFLLNSLIFILIGLQLRYILDELRDDYTMEQLVWYGMAISLTVILVRLIWVFPAAYVPRMLSKRIREREPYPPWQGVLVIGWTGLRGVVSLAAAMAIPPKLPDGSTFPHRGLILFLTFWVIFVTLVGQGLSLPWLIRLFRVEQMKIDVEPNERELVEESDDEPRLGR
jgi:Na+/H+ antiporter